jgi:hypothetical protein
LDMTRFVLLLLGMTVLACSTNTPGPTGPASPPGRESPPGHDVLSDRIELRLGETVRIYAGDFTIAFDAVLDDSRCPLEVLCFWEGNAAVQLILTDGTGVSTPVTLQTSPGPRMVEYQGVTISLENLKPYPTETSPEDPNQYRLVLQVDDL